MFKKYLRIQPAPIQLILFISFWCALMLLGAFIMQLYVKSAGGIAPGQLEHFVEHDIFRYPNILFASNALFQVFTFLLPALIYAYLADPSPRSYLGGTRPGNTIQVMAIVLLAPCLIFALAPIGEWLKQVDLGASSRAMDEQRNNFIQAYLRSGNAWSVIRSILLIAVVPALCEEIFFRGMVMKFAYSLLRRWWLSIVISALMFAFFHNTLSEFVPIFIAGLVLGWVYYLTGSLWMNILLHLLFNGLQALFEIYGGTEPDKSLEQPSALFMVFGIATVLVAGGLLLLYRKRTPLPAGWNVFVAESKEDITGS